MTPSERERGEAQIKSSSSRKKSDVRQKKSLVEASLTGHKAERIHDRIWTRAISRPKVRPFLRVEEKEIEPSERCYLCDRTARVVWCELYGVRTRERERECVYVCVSAFGERKSWKPRR